MIAFADSSIVPYILMDESYFILNLFNPVNIGTNIDRLFPDSNLLQVCPYDAPEFEKIYMNYIMNKPDAFQDMMEIMMAYYYNGNVVILTDLTNELIESMVDCIIKLIQKRYGYNCCIIRTLDDVLIANESKMSDDGIARFMYDKEIYVKATVDAKKLIENVEKVGIESDKCI